jgi:hypothetical protein
MNGHGYSNAKYEHENNFNSKFTAIWKTDHRAEYKTPNFQNFILWAFVSFN